MSEVERVALLALVYREFAKGCSVGARTEPSDLYDDLQATPGSLSLLTIVGSTNLPSLDWAIVRALDQPEQLPELAAALVDYDPLRYEALLHAWPKDAPEPAAGLLYLERWDEIEEAIAALEATGLTATRDDVEDAALDAYVSATGASLDESLDAFDE
jgi:hypothetical protein